MIANSFRVALCPLIGCRQSDKTRNCILWIVLKIKQQGTSFVQYSLIVPYQHLPFLLKVLSTNAPLLNFLSINQDFRKCPPEMGFWVATHKNSFGLFCKQRLIVVIIRTESTAIISSKSFSTSKCYLEQSTLDSDPLCHQRCCWWWWWGCV